MTQRRVTATHTRSYDDPVRVGAGETLIFDGRQSDWEGHRWLWAVDAAGRGGWVPGSFARAGCKLDGMFVAAPEDFDAIELTCTAGEGVTVLRESHGWAWCENAAGARGWVPLSCLGD
ncbi:MAG: SH3 domain-containing protein [Pseudomonadota bacterium]